MRETMQTESQNEWEHKHYKLENGKFHRLDDNPKQNSRADDKWMICHQFGKEAGVIQNKPMTSN